MQSTENREVVELLRNIEKKLSALSLDHLTAKERDQAFEIRLQQEPLGDIIALVAERHGLSTDDYLRQSLKPKDKSQPYSVYELAGAKPE